MGRKKNKRKWMRKQNAHQTLPANAVVPNSADSVLENDPNWVKVSDTTKDGKPYSYYLPANKADKKTSLTTTTTNTATAITSAPPAKPHYPANSTLLPLDAKTLRKICLAPEEDFILGDWLGLPQPEVIDTPNGNLIYFDMGADILGVAHLDSYGTKFNHFERIGDRIYTASLDDRVGAYVITAMLDQKRFPHDILLTTGEEMGMSTASYFMPERDYKWMFEFDRGGDDVVMYDYHDTTMSNLLQSYGYKVGRGAFTDICYLEHLGVKGINFPVGYYDYHDRYAYMEIAILEASVRRFTAFYRDHKDKTLTHTPLPKATKGGYYSGRNYYGYGSAYDWDDYRPLNATEADDLGKRVWNKRKGKWEDAGDQLDCEYCGIVYNWEQDTENCYSIHYDGACISCMNSMVKAADWGSAIWGSVVEEEEEESWDSDALVCGNCDGSGLCVYCGTTGLCPTIDFMQLHEQYPDDAKARMDAGYKNAARHHVDDPNCTECNKGLCLHCRGTGYCDSCEATGKLLPPPPNNED